jgi:hypothetical protein
MASAERRTGLEQARTEARSWATFRVILGCANPKREAWVLCGFDPVGDDEERRIQELRRELGFAPHLEAHQLTATNEQARRSAKRVLRMLSGGDETREEVCWKETSLDTLYQRGEGTGLRAYLQDVTDHLVPLLAAR